ncbi:MAG: hypothetical protein AMXMBFR12_09040 [Candidatus Babeliales bacterium]
MKKISLVFGLSFCMSSVNLEPPLEEESFQDRLKLENAVTNTDSAEVLRLLLKGIDPSVSPQLLCIALERRKSFSRGQEKEQQEYERSRKQIIELLINNPRTNLNCKNADGDTPLIYFARMGHLEYVEKLLKSGRVDLNAVDKLGFTASALVKRPDMQKLFAQHGASVIAPPQVSSVSTWHSYTQPQRPIAATPKAAPQIPAIPTSYQYTSPPHPAFAKPAPRMGLSLVQQEFFDAVKQNNLEKVNQLFAAGGIDLNVADQNGATPLVYAIKNNSLPMVMRLLKMPIAINQKIGLRVTTYLMGAISGGKSSAIIAELLKHPDIDLNILNNEGLTALDYALLPGRARLEIIDMLIKRQAVTGAFRQYAVRSQKLRAQAQAGQKRSAAEMMEGAVQSSVQQQTIPAAAQMPRVYIKEEPTEEEEPVSKISRISDPEL